MAESENEEASLERIREAEHRLDSLYRKWLYRNLATGEYDREKKRFRELVNSIRRRRRSLRFHAWLILEWQRNYEEGMSHSLAKLDAEERGYLREGVRQAGYLFDDLIFNSISLFDYLACLSVQVHIGSEESRGPMWGQLPNRVRNASHDGPKSVATVARKWDTELVGNLKKYRGELIHQGADPPTGSKLTYPGTGEQELVIKQPPGFTASKALGAENLEVPIQRAAQLLYERSLEVVADIMESLVRDLRMKPFPGEMWPHQARVCRWELNSLYKQVNSHPSMEEHSLGLTSIAFTEDDAALQIHGPDGFFREHPTLSADEILAHSAGEIPACFVANRILSVLQPADENSVD